VRAITLLLEEEQTSATVLEAKAVVPILQLAPTTASSSTPPPPSSRGDAAVVAMLHAQACEVQNICYLVLTILYPSSIGYAYRRDQVLLILKCYDLTDHILSDASLINDLAWECVETVVLSWIFSTITAELQDIVKELGVATCQI
jgi:hypothetical protein